MPPLGPPALNERQHAIFIVEDNETDVEFVQMAFKDSGTNCA